LRVGLRAVYERSVGLFRADPRVLAAHMSGSVGTEREDEHSDVDPVLLVKADDFDAFDRDLPVLFRQLGVKPVLWWPERINCETLRNYAVLFELEGELLQYDITISAAGEGTRAPVRPGRVIFDKADVLQVVGQSHDCGFSPERLRWTVEMYWLYVFIHSKYLKRGDRLKLVAAQHELLHCHLEVLLALDPEVSRDWWPIMAERVCQGRTEQVCLSYLAGVDVIAAGRALPTQMMRFSQDARAACRKWCVEYPADLEARVALQVKAVMDEVVGSGSP